MAKEIERKFLVRSDEWRSLAQPTRYRQGYLSSVKERVVRVRTIGGRGFLTIKGITKDVSRLEFEYDVPLDDAGGPRPSVMHATGKAEAFDPLDMSHYRVERLGSSSRALSWTPPRPSRRCQPR